MTSKEAIELLREIADKYHGTKKDHILLDEALETLIRATTPQQEDNVVSIIPQA